MILEREGAGQGYRSKTLPDGNIKVLLYYGKVGSNYKAHYWSFLSFKYIIVIRNTLFNSKSREFLINKISPNGTC